VSDVDSHSAIKIGSERNFGLTFSAFFVLVALWPLIRGGSVRLVPLGLAAMFLIAALFYPRGLAPLNRLWFRFGLGLAKITGPIVMGIVFAVAIIPAGFLKRRFGTDVLRLKRDPQASTYWLKRGADPSTNSMKRQF
jgi:predicted membrane metal-binding protein